MKNLFPYGLVAVIVLLLVSVSQASLLHSDTAYWYQEGNQILTQFNPNAEWLDDMIPTGRVIMSIQESVYDEVSTQSILRRNGDGTGLAGFLYAYSITNLYAGDINNTNDTGVSEFAVRWNFSPAYVTVSRQSASNWVVDTSASNEPAWKWTGSPDAGIRLGETIGGFWAVSNVKYSGETEAIAVCIDNSGPKIVSGRTTGPVPDPATFVTLATGLVGLSLKRRLRVK